MSLPTDAEERKHTPLYSGCLAYFPDALEAVSKVELSIAEPVERVSEIILDLASYNDKAPDVEKLAKVAGYCLALLNQEAGREEAGFGAESLPVSGLFQLLTRRGPALACVAGCSYAGNEQHNPGQPLHWDRSKSTDESDAFMRHFIEQGTTDSDGVLHMAKATWRALAWLQKAIEAKRKKDNCTMTFEGTFGADKDQFTGFIDGTRQTTMSVSWNGKAII